MKLPRVRFTIRNTMIAVAVVAIMIAAEQMRIRWAQRRAKAGYYARSEQLHREEVRQVKLQMLGGRSGFDLALSQCTRMAERAGQLKRKWEAAAARPWSYEPPEPPPDPPAPSPGH